MHTSTTKELLAQRPPHAPRHSSFRVQNEPLASFSTQTLESLQYAEPLHCGPWMGEAPIGSQDSPSPTSAVQIRSPQSSRLPANREQLPIPPSLSLHAQDASGPHFTLGSSQGMPMGAMGNDSQWPESSSQRTPSFWMQIVLVEPIVASEPTKPPSTDNVMTLV